MKRILHIAITAAVLLCGCKGEKKIAQYQQLYAETPSVVYIAPLNDRAPRRAIRELDDSAYNASLNTAAMQMYLTAADPLISRGYYTLGPLASAQIAATETRTGKQLRDGDIADLYANLGIDAILFIDIIAWETTLNTWSVEAEYVVRSTHTGGELLFAHVKATKMLGTDFKGIPQPLKEDLDFADQYQCDIPTAQRCRLVEILNNYVLTDMPTGNRARVHDAERYTPSHPAYFNLRIHRDGSIEQYKSTEE